MVEMNGTAASPGIAAGRVFVLKEAVINIGENKIIAENIAAETEKLKSAIQKSKSQLASIREKAKRDGKEEKAEILSAQIMLLEDQVLIDDITGNIENELVTAENAVIKVMEKYLAIFSGMDNEYMRERAADIKDISLRTVRNIMGIDFVSLDEIEENVILVARDLTPSDTAQIDSSKVAAIATDIGGKTSHTAIMARSLEIPAVVGLANITAEVRDKDTIIVDGTIGKVYVNPGDDLLKEHQRRIEAHKNRMSAMRQIKGLPAVTSDGRRTVELSANIGTPKDVMGVQDNGAEGIGLYRTEFLYMDRDKMPDEEEQFAAYREVAEAMNPKPVIIRTLDIGGDKKLPYLGIQEELNPFLGWRAIRMCLDKTDIFKTQLRAILRASNYGNISIMYPMISGADEIDKANGILAEVKKELENSKQSFDQNIKVGIMIEIPSAAITADILAKKADFFSIGTNDLIQYTLAADRTNEKVAGLYEPLHPAVLRMVKNVIDAAHSEGKWVGMCGEAAGDLMVVPILLGMGLDEFSTSAVSILEVKRLIRSLSYEDARNLSKKALKLDNAKEIREAVKELLGKNGTNY